MVVRLFITKRFERIDRRCPASGNAGGDQTGKGEYDPRRYDGECIRMERAMEQMARYVHRKHG